MLCDTIPTPLKDKRLDLASLSFDELKAYLANLGQKAFRTTQVFRAIHQRGVLEIADLTELSLPLREQLKDVAVIHQAVQDKVFVASDGTRKYQFKTIDGHIFESVFIPNASADGRNTLCISSQVGCAMGCTFCATAAIKLKRNLNASEIAGQIYAVDRDLRKSKWDNPLKPHSNLDPESERLIHNIVYMGMGEPLHNYEQVVRSIHLLCDHRGQYYAPKRITVSTSGVVKNIKRLGEDTKVHLAISLNATTDEVRTQIMPVNQKWNIEALLDACRNYPLNIRRRITYEYVMLKDINDTDEDALRIVSLLKGMESKVNLIPFNPHPLAPFKRPSMNRVLAFQRILLDRHLSVFIRTTRGEEVDAACGMLGARKLEEARA